MPEMSNPIGWCDESLSLPVDKGEYHPVIEGGVRLQSPAVQPLQNIAGLFGAIARRARRDDVARSCLPAMRDGNDMVPARGRLTTIGALATEVLQQGFSSFMGNYLYASPPGRGAIAPGGPKGFTLSISFASVGIATDGTFPSVNHVFGLPRLTTPAPFKAVFECLTALRIGWTRSSPVVVTGSTAGLETIAARGGPSEEGQWLPLLAGRATFQPSRSLFGALFWIKSKATCSISVVACQVCVLSHKPILTEGNEYAN